MINIGIVTISDRASQGVYDDLSGQSIENWLTDIVISEFNICYKLIPDEYQLIVDTLKKMSISQLESNNQNKNQCNLIFTTGGTGPQVRDVTPEATLFIADKVMDGFGEQMRRASLEFVPTAILSRQVAVIRGKSLIINLPGKPKAIKECLDSIFAAIPYCLDLLGAPRVETDNAKLKSFRPKN